MTMTSTVDSLYVNDVASLWPHYVCKWGGQFMWM